jgi:hypothetical protein
MKVPLSLRTMSVLEMTLLAIMIIYIVLPLRTSAWLAPYVASPLGMVVLFCITISLFVYTNPVLGVLYILVAYEALRRSTSIAGKVVIVENTPSQEKKDIDLRLMNPTKEKTIEEEVIEVRAPIGKSVPTEYINSSYKPVADKLEGASLV